MYSEQNEMKERCRLLDVLHWQVERCVNGSHCEACSSNNTAADVHIHRPVPCDDSRPLTYVAGVDISYVKNDTVNACAACVVVKLPDFDVRILCLFGQYTSNIGHMIKLLRFDGLSLSKAVIVAYNRPVIVYSIQWCHAHIVLLAMSDSNVYRAVCLSGSLSVE